MALDDLTGLTTAMTSAVVTTTSTPVRSSSAISLRTSGRSIAVDRMAALSSGRPSASASATR